MDRPGLFSPPPQSRQGPRKGGPAGGGCARYYSRRVGYPGGGSGRVAHAGTSPEKRREGLPLYGGDDARQAGRGGSELADPGIGQSRFHEFLLEPGDQPRPARAGTGGGGVAALAGL